MKYALLLFLLSGLANIRALEPRIVAADDDKAGVVQVKIDGKIFTGLHYKKFAKPVLFPVIGPTGATMVRQWPVAEAAPGEEKDHPHHKGLWFTHGAVNGVDFWAEGPKAGRIIVVAKPKITITMEKTEITTDGDWWRSAEGKHVCTSSTTITCGLDGEDRYIDYAITIKASEGDVTFGDTKEGMMAIRSHPALNLKGKVATGHAVNSEGQKDADIWGKHARWVDYSGTVEGKVTGIACFDHPDNLRHPTTWHARDYGLIAANPFGLHDFEKTPKGAGDHVIRKGESLTLRYRWLFHTGDTAAAKIEERWKKWAGK